MIMRKFAVSLKSEGDGTITNNLSYEQTIVELSHQFKNGLWEIDDVYQVSYDGQVVAEFTYYQAEELFS